jgi:NADP-dependent 3-hydroxy acid dehydrogenase YdfG
MPGTVLDRFRLDDRVAVITGASSGLGVAFATALAEAGADLVLAGRRTDRLEQTRALAEAPMFQGPRRRRPW